MKQLHPYVDPREDGGVPLTQKQIEKACADDAHVLPIAALHRPGSYRCVYCTASVDVPVPLSEVVL